MRIGKLESLNTKEASEILNLIAEHWSIDENFIKNFKNKYFFLKNADEKIFAVSKKIAELQISHLRINSAGLYIAEAKKEYVRLSVEGSQIFGPEAKKNIIEITSAEARQWVTGADLENNGKYDSYNVEGDEKNYAEKAEGFVIIKRRNDFFGCGKMARGKIINYFPKARRMSEIS